MSLNTLFVDQVRRRADARPINSEVVSSLAASISSVGLIHPIRVRQTDAGWELVSGSHRLAAMQQLGHRSIDCFIVSDDDLHAELAMIDENLCRNELSPTERARHTARRKAIYEELHPETKHGGDRSEPSRQVGDLKEADRFTVETAAATGKSERSVQRDAERGAKVIDEVKNLIAGTELDTGSYLDKIKNLPPNDQVHAAKRDLAHARSAKRKTSKPQIAKKPASASPLMDAWTRASSEERTAFLRAIGAEIVVAEVA